MKAVHGSLVDIHGAGDDRLQSLALPPSESWLASGVMVQIRAYSRHSS